jgi:hypothetical protein
MGPPFSQMGSDALTKRPFLLWPREEDIAFKPPSWKQRAAHMRQEQTACLLELPILPSHKK